jgi:hypothetical protein
MSEVATIERADGQLMTMPDRQPDLIQLAIEKGMDADSLGKLFDLLERRERMEAQKRFADAVAGFQAECQTVFKNRTAKIKTERGEYSYQYASFDDIMREASPVLAKYGIAISFDCEQVTDGGINKLTVIVRVRVGGYFEDRKFGCPIPTSTRVTEPQAYGTALSYAKRYALCAALNIVGTDKDDDAAGLIDSITADEHRDLKDLMDLKRADLKRFLAWASEASGIEVPSLDKLPRKVLPKAIDMLNRKKAG